MRPFAHRQIVIVLFAMVFMGSSSVIPKEQNGKAAGAQKKDETKEPLSTEALETLAAVRMIGAGDFFAAMGERMLASGDAAALKNWRFVFEEPLPIYYEYLDAIRDGRSLPDIRLALGKTLRKLPEWERRGSPDWGWYKAFNYALRRADEADMEMFKKGAENYKDVVYSHLKAAPEKYRGKIITITGNLSVIRREDPPRQVPENIERIYTGYVNGPTKGAPPFAIAFTELPQNVEPSENLNLDVTFHGYFLSLVRFPPDKKEGKKQEDIISPYLVGKTLIVKPTKEKGATEGPHSFYLIVGIVGGFVIVALLVAAMNIWLRRGDRRIQSQLAALRDKNRPFNLEPAQAEPEPAAENPAANMTPNPHNAVEPAPTPNGPNPPTAT